MILNNQIWKQTIAAAIAAVAGKAEWIRAIERGAREIERAAYWSFDAQTGVLKIKSTTSGKLYAITADEHVCEATAKYGKRCKHQTALRLLIRYTQALGVAAAEVETVRVQNWSARKGHEVVETKRLTVETPRAAMKRAKRGVRVTELTCLRNRPASRWVTLANAGAGV